MNDLPREDEPSVEPATLPFAGVGNEAATELVEILEKYLNELKAGQQPDREKLLREHPHLRQQLDACLAGLDFIHHSDQPAPKRLGDFHILREIGRGGMGAVYEADQISLGRRVALKIMRFGGLSDIEAEGRFQREAETVARLHHTNIVPIFTVGQEHGINYYAMQYIEGRSLATVLEQEAVPISPTRVAQWGLQAAEALAHAHERGIVHRDVKPSNLLIDDEGRIWLTDFGLAKRANDVTLSMTGALLGTPRYMSPEQASAKTRNVDQRTDIYSLGAALYELVTNQPVFKGDSPHHVICQIVADDPVPPRQIVASIPRDLDTIIMKCLSKDPDERYQSAQGLASDLRAFIEGRSITARRPSVAELTVRWMKRQQRSVILAGSAVAITLLLLVGSAAGWFVYSQWRQSFLSLTTNQPPLFVEITQHNQDRVLVEETVPTRQPISLAAGEYAVRVSGKARLSQDYRVELQRAHRANYSLQLDDQLLWSNIQAPRMYYLLKRQAGTNLLLFSDSTLTLIDGRTGARSWDCNVVTYAKKQADPLIQKFAGLMAPDFYAADEQPEAAPWLADGFSDIDQDGHEDIILAGRTAGWLLAVSHASGEPLWLVRRGPESTNSQRTAFAARPIMVGDLDNDQVNDLIVSVMSGDPFDPRTVERWMEAVSGKGGSTIWKHDLSKEWFQLPPNVTTPLGLQRRLNSSGSGSGGGSSSWYSRAYMRGRSYAERSGPHFYAPDAPILKLRADDPENSDRPSITFISGQHVVQLDVATGQPIQEPQLLPVRPTYPVRWADIDGDRFREAIIVEEVARPAATFGLDKFGVRLTAWSIAKGQLLWQRDLEAFWPRQVEHTIPAPVWPLLDDLDGDGATEVLVPNDSTASLNSPGFIPSQEIEVIDGRTGKARWQYRIRNIDQQVDHFVTGPDINDDGFRDVFVASLWGYHHELYIDAISGKDGKPLWLAHRSLTTHDMNHDDFYLRTLHCWQNGGDATLLVTAQSQGGSYSSLTGFAVRARDGDWLGEISGASEFRNEDFDLNGLDEMLMVQQDPNEIGLLLDCLRGHLPDQWRRLGGDWQVGADYDRDGTRDWVLNDASSVMSSASGDILWRGSAMTGGTMDAIDPTVSLYYFSRAKTIKQRDREILQHTDLNGDQVPDMLLTNTGHYGLGSFHSPLQAFSGRTGEALWSAEMQLQGVRGMAAIETRDLDHDSRPEIVYVIASDFGYPLRTSGGTGEAQLRVFLLDGRNGKVRWNAPLTKEYGKSSAPNFPYYFDPESHEQSVTYVDINQDKHLDIVLPAESKEQADQWELQALDGRSGAMIWNTPLYRLHDSSEPFQNCGPFTTIDLDGDKQEEIVSVTYISNSQINWQLQLEVKALSSIDGTTIWAWQSPSTYSINLNRPRGGPGKLEWLQRSQVTIARGRTGPLLVVNLYPWNEPESHLIVLNSKGQQTGDRIVQRTKLVLPVAYDIDDDDVDELIYADNGSVQAIRADDTSQTIWQFATTGFQIDSLQLLPGADLNGPVLAAVGESANGTVYGLNPKTGQRLWTSPGTLLSNSRGALPWESFGILEGAVRGRPPLIGIRQGVVTCCRGVSLVDSSPSTSAEPIHDPRYARKLPWAERDGVNFSYLVSWVGWGLFFSLTLVVLPGFVVVRGIARRRISLRGLLLTPIFVALISAALLAKTNSPDTLLGKFGTAVMFLPVILFVSNLLRSVYRQQLRRILIWVLVVLVIGVAIGAVNVTVDARQMPLAADEYYSFDQWYWPIFPAVYVTGILMPLVAAFRALRWRRIRKPLPAKLTGV